jgi:hypothetical protein
MDHQYTPNIVSMDGLYEAVAASVSLSHEEQQQYSASAANGSIDPGQTMGMYPTFPSDP